ncbi:tetratricopeptide repeat protein, partial [Paracoccaceae bacterium]|nr:tetratricopeptide repeat protein [Paracoccaceae bacterium]
MDKMELTLDQALQKGVDAHRAGKAQEAELYYTSILKTNPKHSNANHNMGVLAVGVGKVQESLPFFRAALDTNPDTAQFWLSYIDALIKLERRNDAKVAFDQAKSKGAKGDAFDNLEIKLNESLNSQHKVFPDGDLPQEQQKSLMNLYNQKKLREVFTEAQTLTKKYNKSLILWNLMGASAAQIGQLDEAVTSFQKAISIKPDYVDAYNN